MFLCNRTDRARKVFRYVNLYAPIKNSYLQTYYFRLFSVHGKLVLRRRFFVLPCWHDHQHARTRLYTLQRNYNPLYCRSAEVGHEQA